MFKTAEVVHEAYAAAGFQKVAGVELHLVGYHREPTHTNTPEAEAAMDEWARGLQAHVSRVSPYPERKLFVKKDPGLRGFFGGKVDDPEGYRAAILANSAARKEWEAKNPSPAGYVDPDEYSRDSRILTPHAKEVHGKFMAYTLGASKLPVGTTDFNYTDTPYENRLSRADIMKLLEHHEQVARTATEPGAAEAHQTFRAHADALLKDPRMKFARLEWT